MKHHTLLKQIKKLLNMKDNLLNETLFAAKRNLKLQNQQLNGIRPELYELLNI